MQRQPADPEHDHNNHQHLDDLEEKNGNGCQYPGNYRGVLNVLSSREVGHVCSSRVYVMSVPVGV